MKLTKKIVVVFTLALAGLALLACKAETTNAAPTFAGVGAVAVDLYGTFDALSGVTANDAEDGDLTASITVTENNVDTTVVGSFTVKYSVTDSASNTTTVTRTVTVNAIDESEYPLANYLSGVDLSKLSAEDKGILFSAAERYLLENVLAGVPLYTRASRVMYSSRVQLFSPEYNGVMGFGTAFSQFSADDSTVLMYGDTYGQAGEYTWRASFNTDPTTLNPWIADDSATSDFIDLFTGGLYDMFFDATKTGYEINPVLAASNPVPVDPEEINGKIYATVWQIPVRDDLTWKFHPDTDVSGLAAGYEKLDASDYLWTWKYALDNDWFRARTGGGDFVSQGIKGAADYLNGTVGWDSVGLRMADGEDNTLELEFTTSKSMFEIKYMFAGGVLSPINEELFTELGEDGYGVSPTTVASSGVYYFETWTPLQLLTFAKNTSYPLSDMYHYTGEQFRFIDGSDAIFAEFIAGRLDSAAVPAASVEQYASDPRVKTAPDATTWRLMINGFGTEDARDAYIAAHPEVGLVEDFVPEPILQYLEMRQALFYGFNRYYAAVDLVKLYLPAATLFAPTYFLDGESGLSVRGTDAGAAIVDDFSGDSYGYYPDAAVALFKQAVAQGIADGYYTAGTASEYTTIELVLTYASSGNTSAQAMVAELEKEYEELLVDDVNFVKLDIVVDDVAFPNNYYDYMMVANTDLGIGGISGSLLDAPSFLDVFSDDNRGGFTLNWGIDTTTPNIPVAYTNLEGKVVYETWGYNALIEALTGKTYVKDGVEQDAWTNSDDLIDAYLDMSGEVKASSSDGATLAGYVLGDDLATIATDEGFDGLAAYIVVTESGKNFLFVVAQEGSEFKLYQQLGLSTSA
ncbi:MAG: ABC transporter substrate-binding protein, partial [Candidatus Izemoplasmatales bacterium]